MAERMALIGAGVMGSAIGTRLLQTGHALSVYDPHPEKQAALVALGAVAASSAAEAARAADAVILSLNSSRIVREAMFGPSGIAEGAAPGLLVIDMSSIDPAATREVAAEARAKGLGFVDSPLSGGVPKALTGELALMLGGEAADVDRAMAVLAPLSRNRTHMGPSGAGQTTKIINQVLCGLNFLAVAEATRLAEMAGVDISRIPGALAGGRADSAILAEYMPRFAARDYRRTGRIDNMVKDLGMALDLARETGTDLPMTALGAALHRRLVEAGLGAEDQAMLMELFRDSDKEPFE